MGVGRCCVFFIKFISVIIIISQVSPLGGMIMDSPFLFTGVRIMFSVHGFVGLSVLVLPFLLIRFYLSVLSYSTLI